MALRKKTIIFSPLVKNELSITFFLAEDREDRQGQDSSYVLGLKKDWATVVVMAWSEDFSSGSYFLFPNTKPLICIQLRAAS